MLLEARCHIEPTDSTGQLHDKLAAIGVPALNQSLELIANNLSQPIAQDHQQTNYAAKINKLEQVIDWQQPAEVIERKIRAFNPFPIAYTHLNNERIKIWRAEVVPQVVDAPHQPGSIIHCDKKTLVVACGVDALALKQIQLPGGKVLEIPAVMNSKADMFSCGTRFDSLTHE
jgi:methionyl-tRNA formyltransferase